VYSEIHTTVIHSVNTIVNELEYNEFIISTLAEIKLIHKKYIKDDEKKEDNDISAYFDIEKDNYVISTQTEYGKFDCLLNTNELTAFKKSIENLLAKTPPSVNGLILNNKLF